MSTSSVRSGMQKLAFYQISRQHSCQVLYILYAEGERHMTIDRKYKDFDHM